MPAFQGSTKRQSDSIARVQVTREQRIAEQRASIKAAQEAYTGKA